MKFLWGCFNQTLSIYLQFVSKKISYYKIIKTKIWLAFGINLLILSNKCQVFQVNTQLLSDGKTAHSRWDVCHGFQVTKLEHLTKQFFFPPCRSMLGVNNLINFFNQTKPSFLMPHGLFLGIIFPPHIGPGFHTSPRGPVCRSRWCPLVSIHLWVLTFEWVPEGLYLDVCNQFHISFEFQFNCLHHFLPFCTKWTSPCD